MKSSEPVFTKQNPFQPASRVGKAHYHPSSNQSLSKKERKTTLSPVRSNQQSGPQLHTLSPKSQQLPKRDHCLTATHGKPDFAETWSSTDFGSSVSTTNSSNMETFKQPARARKSTVFSEPEVRQDSILAKYIERFRHGRPQSREDRQPIDSATGVKQQPFWWMSPSALPPSSTPTKIADEDVIQPLKDDHGSTIFSPAGPHQHDRSLSPCRGSLSVLSETSQGEFDDFEILHLQERANRLLLRDECTLNDGSIQISSEGLECSDFSSPVSVDEPLRTPLIPSITKSTTKSTTVKASSHSVQAASSQKSSVIPSLAPPTRPEEDILFQWRLRRKIEQAREWPQSLQHSSFHGPTFSCQAPSLSHPSAIEQSHKQQQSTQSPEFSQKATHPHIGAPQPDTKEVHASCLPASGPAPFPAFVVPGSSVSQLQTIAHVPAHMHFLCDVLPCPMQSSHTSRQQNISKSTDESHTKVVQKKTQVPRKSIETVTDEPNHEHRQSTPPAASGAIEGEGPCHNKAPERDKKEKTHTKEPERKTSTSLTKQKKPRYTLGKEHADVPGSTNKTSLSQRVSKKVMPRAEQRELRRSGEISSDGCTRGYAPPPSPIHSALGQVVSEVLFPTVDSSPAQRNTVSSVSPPCTASASPQSLVPSCETQNSVEVISQLLQEAEESDGKEFEDDPLLQVLRKQRTWVKEQISEVDTMLNELDEQQVIHTKKRDT